MVATTHPLLPPTPAGPSSGSFTSKYFVQSAAEGHAYHPKSVLQIASRTTIQAAGIGTVLSTVQNALEKHDKGAMGVFTRTGSTIAFFAAMGFSFSAVQAITANIRETDDSMNGVAGGCAAGFVAGIRARSLPMAVGSCAFIGTVVGSYQAGGNNWTGFNTNALTRAEKEEKRLQFFMERPERPALGEPRAPAPA